MWRSTALSLRLGVVLWGLDPRSAALSLWLGFRLFVLMWRRLLGLGGLLVVRQSR
jgi:hypothetical protein